MTPNCGTSPKQTDTERAVRAYSDSFGPSLNIDGDGFWAAQTIILL